MNWRALIFLAAIHGAAASEASKAIALGRSARADGVPQAAIYDLKRAAAGSSGPEEIQVLVELSRCLIAARREDEAVGWLKKTIYRDEPAVIFWRAQAQAQKGSYEAALADYERAAQIDFEMHEDAMLGRARMLEALGRGDEALDIYAKISRGSRVFASAQIASASILIKQDRRDEAERRLKALAADGAAQEMKKYLQGRVDLERGDVNAAREVYKNLEGQDLRIAAGVAIGQADALSRTGKDDKAEETLESFVRENAHSPMLDVVLAKLDEVRGREKNPSNVVLKQWEKDDSNPALAASATYYLARNDERQDRNDRAMKNYVELIKRHPGHPLRTAAIIRLSRLLLAAGKTKEAGTILSMAGEVADRADQAKLRFLDAAAGYQAVDFATASKAFVRAANLDPHLSEAALSNAAIAAISAGNEPLAAEILNALRKENAVAARRIELVEAFQGARAGNPDAGEQLAWLADHGGAIGDKARLALAEWRWQSGDATGARSEFRRVANSPAAGRGDQKDYFSVYLADDGSLKAAEAVSQAAQEFLKRNPDSPRESLVRLKWGETLMRAGDYRNARVQFEEAARSADDVPIKQSASFLAARAAAGSMEPAELEAAISLLEDVASDKTNPLAAQARLEQAMLQSALGHPEESVKLLDSLLAATRDPRLQFAARLKKGEALLSMGGKDKARLDDAIGEWRAIAADPSALPAERNEALARAAAASAQAGDFDAALAAYYEVLTSPRDKQPEYFWYYKAGFEAANLLVARSRFQEAAAIYAKMAAAPGPRAGEAEAKVKHLRLENFIWED